MSRFRSLIRNRNFSLLWIGQVISQFGDRLDQMALIALIYRFAPGSTTQLAKIMSFTILPVFLIGPVAGVYVDRWDRRRTMIVCDILRGFLVLTIPFFLMRIKFMPPIYGVIFLVFAIGRFYIPAKMAIIPDLVREEDLLLANSLVSVTGMVAAMFGLGLGGVLVSAIGAEGGFIVDGVSFLVSGVAVFFLSTNAMRNLKKERVVEVGRHIAEVVRKSVVEELRETLAFLKSQKQLKSCFGILFFLWAALGSVYVVSIVFIQQVFASVTKELGFLAISLGAGLFLGTLVYGRIGLKISSLLRVIFACLFLGGVSLSAFVLVVLRTSNLALALILTFVLGATIAPIMIVVNTAVQELTENSMRGKVFSSLEIVVHLAFLAAMLVAAPLADRIGPVVILLTVGALLMVTGGVGLSRRYAQA